MQIIPSLELTRYRSALKHFVEFKDDEWQLFVSHLYPKSLKKKELFVKPEKTSDEIAFILSGSFRFYVIREGIEVSNYFCFSNELISSYRSFLLRTPGGIAVEAMEDAELICFNHASLQTLLADDRISFTMERFGRKVAEYLICCYEERVLSFVTQTPEERYRMLLDQQPRFLQLIPQHYLANYLGITPVSLSRIRKRILSTRPAQKIAS